MKRDFVVLGLVSALGLAACSEKSVTDPPVTPTLAITLGTTTGQITQAGTLTVTVNVTRGSFEGAVSITANGMPGITAVPLTIPGNSTSGTLTVMADAATGPGNGTLTIAAAGPNGTPATAATLALNVNVRGSYTLGLNQATLSLAAGASGTATIGIARVNNFPGAVNLAVTAPNGISALVTPNPATGLSATLSVTVASSVAAGNYSIVIIGTTPGLANQSATLAVTVTATTAPPFSGTIFIDPDIITPSDPSAFTALSYAGQGSRTMFDRRVNAFITLNAFLFNASFNDGLTIEVQVNPEFGTVAASQTQAQLYASAVGRLPTALRRDVRTMWIHQGVQPFGGGNNNILIHVGQADQYVAAGILEETLVHEATHSSLDASHAAASGWLAAQAADPTFISTYARDFPTREDVAESFLTWLAVRHRADRISDSLRAMILAAIPNRLAYFDGLALPLHPIR